jgi:hypothetical protein
MPWLPLWSIVLLLLGSTLLTRSIQAYVSSLRMARLWVAGIGLGAILTLLWWHYARDAYALLDPRWVSRTMLSLADAQTELPPPVMSLIVAVGLWLRGVLDGSRAQLRDDFWQASATAFLAFALLLVAGQIDPAGLPPYALYWMIALIVVSMSALALSSLELANNFGDWKSPRATQPTLNRDWLLSVGVVIVAVLTIGFVLGALLTPDLIAYAFGWVGVVLGWVAAIIGYVMMAVAYVLFLFLTPLITWLQARVGEPADREPLTLDGFQRPESDWANQPALELSPVAAETVRWLGLLGVLIVVGVLFALALHYLRRERDEEPDETRETILTRALLQAQMASLWQNWLDRLRRPTSVELPPYLGLEGEPENRRAIRALYQTLLARAKAWGLPRAPAQTPDEYQATLTKRWPAQQSAWQSLTQSYVATRYSDAVPATYEVETVRQAWREAERALDADAPPADTDAAAVTPNLPDGSRREGG